MPEDATSTQTQSGSGPAESAAEGISESAKDTALPETETEKQTAQPDSGQADKADTDQQAQAAEKPDPEKQPITDWSKVNLDIPKDSQIDPDVLAAFGELAQKEGLTPVQAKAAVHFQLDAIRKAQAAYLAEQEKILKDAWGADIKRNSEQVMSLVTRISRIKGLEDFPKAFDMSGAANNATVLKGLHAIAALLEEDGTGTPSGAAGGGSREETALEGIQAVFAEARGA